MGNIIKVLSKIKNKIYRRELGVILSYNLEKSRNNYTDCMENENSIKFKNINDTNEIYYFFNKMGKKTINKEIINEWLDNKNDCWLIFDNEKVIGGCWVFKGKYRITQLTEHWLSEKNTIEFEPNIVYKGYEIINKNYRGRGVHQQFTQFLLDQYGNKRKMKKMIFVTRASNGAMISVNMKYNGELLGIVEVRNILGRLRRKEFYLNKNKSKKIWR